MNDHETYLLLAAKRINEPLTREEDADLEAHLAACPTCRAIAAGMRRDDIRLRAALAPVAVSPRVRERVMAEASGRRRPDVRLLLGLAAAFALALAGVPLIAGGPGEPTTSGVTSPSLAAVSPSASASPSPSALPSVSVEPSPAPLPSGVGPFINANYTYGETVRRDSLAARLVDGRVVGEWWRSTKVGGNQESFGGPVTCLVIEGDDAWVAGRATTATDGETDHAIFFRLHDGGPDGAGDQAVGYLNNPGQTLATMEGWCQTKYTPAGPFPLTSGDLVVDAGGQP